MRNLFVYGTLKGSDVQKEIIGRTVKMVSDNLKNYSFSDVVIENEIYPILVGCESGSIDGYVFCVTEKELEKVDEYETEAYKRVSVKLSSGITADVYVKND